MDRNNNTLETDKDVHEDHQANPNTTVLKEDNTLSTGGGGGSQLAGRQLPRGPLTEDSQRKSCKRSKPDQVLSKMPEAKQRNDFRPHHP